MWSLIVASSEAAEVPLHLCDRSEESAPAGSAPLVVVVVVDAGRVEVKGHGCFGQYVVWRGRRQYADPPFDRSLL